MFTTQQLHPAVVRDAFGMAQIGRSRHDLMGIRYGEGEGGNGPAGEPNAQDASGAAGGTGGSSGSSDAGGNGSANDTNAGGTGGVRFEELDPRTQAEIRKLRDEAARHRTEKSAAEQRAQNAEEQKNKVLAALGLKADGSEADPDPAELEGTLTQTRAEVENTKRENLVLRVGPTLGANVDRLLDSRSFATKLAGLAPDDRTGIESLIRETLEQDSSLKSAPAPASSSGGTTHTGNTPNGQRKSKQAALAERYPATGIRRAG